MRHRRCNSRMRCPMGQVCHRRRGHCITAEYDDDDLEDANDYIQDEEYYDDAKDLQEEVGFDDEDYAEEEEY